MLFFEFGHIGHQRIHCRFRYRVVDGGTHAAHRAVTFQVEQTTLLGPDQEWLIQAVVGQPEGNVHPRAIGNIDRVAVQLATIDGCVQLTLLGAIDAFHGLDTALGLEPLEHQTKQQGIKVKKGLFPWAASGRAIANGRDEGVTKLLFDDSPEAGSGDGHAGRGHGKILGGGMVGTHAGDMIGEIALAIEMGADAVDIGKTIHPHPTLGESIGMAAEVAHGSCTDVPPARK